MELSFEITIARENAKLSKFFSSVNLMSRSVSSFWFFYGCIQNYPFVTLSLALFDFFSSTKIYHLNGKAFGR